MILTREAITKNVDLKVETVTVPEWGGDVLISEMTGAQRDAFEAFRAAIPRKDGVMVHTKNLRQFAVAQCLVNEKRERLFNDDQATEIGEKNSTVIDRLFDICDRMNKLTDTYLEETEKNSESGQSDDSG